MTRWHFYYPKRFAFSPADYEMPGLGGGESCLVTLTRALAKLGHEIHVFNACLRPGRYDGVYWHLLHEWSVAPAPDVYVAVRCEEAIQPTHGRLATLFWMLDNRTSGSRRFASTYRPRAARIVVASRAMARVLGDAGVPSNWLSYIPLPVDYDLYNPVPHEKRDLVCLFSSMPNRGLDIVARLWPSVQDRHPSALLRVTGGYQQWGYTAEEAKDREEPYHRLLHKLTSGGYNVEVLGVIPKDALRCIQASAALMIYPCRFPEMFCLSAAESAAAGTPCILSDYEALAERVREGTTGYLVAGDPEVPATEAKFTELICRLLSCCSLRAKMGVRARQEAEELSSEHVARMWEALVNGMS